MSDSNRPRGECEHGRLRRQCEVCERDEEITRLRADVARLTGERDEARDGVMGLLPSMARRRGMSTADALEYLAAYTSDWRDYALEWMPLAARTQQAEAERDALRARVKAALDLVAEAEREGQTDDPNVYGIGQAWFDDLRAALAPEQEAQRPGSTSSGAELRDMLQAAEQGLEEMNRQLGIRNAPEQEAPHGE